LVSERAGGFIMHGQETDRVRVEMERRFTIHKFETEVLKTRSVDLMTVLGYER
jgi:hypothetical protein